MLLEKMNETVWHVKQQDGHGIFEFRAREQGGKIKLIGISLIDEDKEQKSISFEMDKSEIYRFYDIVSKFKSIIESPQSFSTAEFNSLNPQIHLNSPAPLGLDGEDVSKAKQSISGGQNILKKKAVGDYDIGLASLEALDQSDQSDQTDEEAMETALNELGFDENQIHSGHIKPVSDGEGSTPNSSSQYTK